MTLPFKQGSHAVVWGQQYSSAQVWGLHIHAGPDAIAWLGLRLQGACVGSGVQSDLGSVGSAFAEAQSDPGSAGSAFAEAAHWGSRPGRETGARDSGIASIKRMQEGQKGVFHRGEKTCHQNRDTSHAAGDAAKPWFWTL